MSWPAKHPGPWRCEFDEIWPAVTDWPILDANGEPVVVTDSGCYPPDPETARAIVDAMNGHEALLAERERLWGFVFKLLDRAPFLPDANGQDLLRQQIQCELAGTPYAMVDGRPIVCLHGRVAVDAQTGRQYEVVRPTVGEEART